MQKITKAAVVAAAGGVVLALGTPAGHAVVLPSSAVLYVSPTGVGTNDGTSCAQATFSSLQAAVDAALEGGTVVGCAGTYQESVTINTQITFTGQGAIIDATDAPYGIGIAASGTTVSGFMVENAHADEDSGAPCDGIVTAGFGETGPVPSSNDVIIGNLLQHNDGSGIDMESTSHTTVSNNISTHNGVGINLVDDLGAASAHNIISGNTTSNNPGGCGIVLADHSGMGVYGNQVIGNTAHANGLGTPSAPNASSGSGIIIAVPTPDGSVRNNLFKGNWLTGNGHGGIALHGHVKGADFSGNHIEENTIGKNNLRTDYKDKKTTGIYLGSVEKLKIQIRNNLFMHDEYAVFTAGPVTVHGLGTDGYVHVKKHHQSISKYAG
jgi:parallel beta helix pectate lyase-like protein